MALPFKNRLSLREYRGRFFELGTSEYSPSLQMIVLKESSLYPQFAVSVSKKVAKKAHDRNLIRRQIQQLVQENITLFPQYKYLFLPKKTNTSYTALKDSFSHLLLKLK